ncbi:MAG: hypothetical protein Q7U64_02455 [Desulfocapsaceae bacterium]|nr:hypothetical protein [Desulfocapsaceae bacterium]
MKRKMIIAVVVLLAGITGWCLHHYSDREVIKRTLSSIAVALGKEGEESPIQLALKMRPVKDFIAPACKVNVPESNYHELLDPELVIRYLIIYRSRQAKLQVAIDGIQVDIPGKGSAEVSALVHVTANQNQHDFFDEVHQVNFSLQKQKKKWQLHQATLPADALVHGH